MTVRIMRCVASLDEPFSLRHVEGAQPPGDYSAYVEDELIQGLSRAVYRRVCTILQPPISSPQEPSRLVFINASDLKRARMKELN